MLLKEYSPHESMIPQSGVARVRVERMNRTMSEMKDRLGKLTEAAVGRLRGMRDSKEGAKTKEARRKYDTSIQKPVLKCSICNGEQVAGFKDIRTGKFEEIALIRNPRELDEFMKAYGIDEISKEY